MRTSFKQLKSYAVETESGYSLGHIVDLVLEVEGQLVAQYLVKTKMIGGETLHISRDQVVRFEEETLIVDDAVKKQEIKEERNAPPIGSSEAIAMTEVE